MSYMHIDNLYKAKDILAFKECYAMEKIHGTSAHVGWKDGKVFFFSGGCEYLSFVKLFDIDDLIIKFTELQHPEIIVYGEAYGGKLQGMRTTYGDQLRFVAFEVKIGEYWLDVPRAENVVQTLGLDFVAWNKVPTTLEALDAERDVDSTQAIKNGMGPGHKREGVVLRPPFEVMRNGNHRIIAKYKRDDFQETKTPRSVKKEDFEVLVAAEAIADEWVTDMRLNHVLDNFSKPYDISQTGEVIKAMIEDITREAYLEIQDSKAARAMIAKKTAGMFKNLIKNQLKESKL